MLVPMLHQNDPVVSAAWWGHEDVVALLLDAGADADVHARNKVRVTFALCPSHVVLRTHDNPDWSAAWAPRRVVWGPRFSP